MTGMTALVHALRPKQWVKNTLVLAVPLAAGKLFAPAVLVPSLVAILAFCSVSSSVYLINDIVDQEADRLHPTKRLRPIASGVLHVRTAFVVAAVLCVGGLALGYAVDPALLAILSMYVGLQVGYSLWFKHEPVLDIAVVTAGFILRAVAGGAAADLPVSQWFLLVAGFGSLFIVAGKRYSELHTLGNEAGTRRALVKYTDTYLRFVWSVAAGATLMSYALWAFEGVSQGGIPWATVSIAPFVVGMLRYAVDIDAGKAAAPEDIVWSDRLLQMIGLGWLVILSLGVLGV